jgi:hypothetical protein
LRGVGISIETFFGRGYRIRYAPEHVCWCFNDLSIFALAQIALLKNHYGVL